MPRNWRTICCVTVNRERERLRQPKQQARFQPYREILNYAEKNQIDLICLGAHGAGFGMRALFGSNVDRVLRQAPCPVLVTRPLKPEMSDVRECESAVAAATF